MFLLALVLPAAIATTELRAVYCLAILTEKDRILAQLQRPERDAVAESVRRLHAYVQANVVEEERSRALRQAAMDISEAQEPEAAARIKSCDGWMP